MQYSELGTYIKNERLKLGLSLNKFAIESEVDSAILSRIENLKQDIKMNVLQKIAHCLGYTPAKFLTKFETEYKNINKKL